LISAERWYRRAVDLHPSTMTHIFLGAVLTRQSRFGEAKRHFRTAARLTSDSRLDVKEEALVNIGMVLRNEGEYRAAASLFRRAIRIDRNYAYARAALKDVEKALHWRKTARKISTKKK